ncbi:MAG: hypothetical protein IKC35_01620 [Clostridia bacterium]|nr:hypothetical protein [Clostridia bacterium]
MKTKKIISASVALLVALTTILFLPKDRQKAFAYSYPQEQAVELELSENVGTRGLFSIISLSMNVNDGQVTATAKNDFTLFTSTVRVYVYLYSSTTNQDSYINMSLESGNYIDDLDMGESISASAAINGVKRYWQARIYYKVDNKDWTEKLSNVWLIDVDGTIINE